MWTINGVSDPQFSEDIAKAIQGLFERTVARYSRETAPPTLKGISGSIQVHATGAEGNVLFHGTEHFVYPWPWVKNE